MKLYEVTEGPDLVGLLNSIISYFMTYFKSLALM